MAAFTLAYAVRVIPGMAVSTLSAETRAARSYYWPALAEVVAFAAAIGAYIWWWRRDAAWTGAFILAAMVISHVLHRESPRRLGFGWRNLRRSFFPLLLLTCAVGAASLAIGLAFHTAKNIPPWQDVTDLGYYFAWGFIQEYILNGFFVNRLEQFHRAGARFLVRYEAAVLFALAHTPNWFLMLVALAAGWVVSTLYRKYRSLYMLGVAHGVIGFCIVLLVPNRISGGLLVGRKYLLHY